MLQPVVKSQWLGGAVKGTGLGNARRDTKNLVKKKKTVHSAVGRRGVASSLRQGQHESAVGLNMETNMLHSVFFPGVQSRDTDQSGFPTQGATAAS